MILHLLNKAPSQAECYQQLRAAIQAEDAVLLIENGVYAATKPGAVLPEASKIFVLTSDFQARGLSGETLSGKLELVDDTGFVNLCCQFEKVVSW